MDVVYGCIVIITIVIGAGYAIGYSIHSYLKQCCINVIKEKNRRYEALVQLNKTVRFCPLRDQICCKTLKNKAQFDRFLFDKAAQQEVNQNREKYEQMIVYARKNRELYKQYLSKVKGLPAYITPTEAKQNHAPVRMCIKMEQTLIQETQLHPLTRARLIYKKFYISPKGRNRYKSTKLYGEESICRMIEVAKRKEQEQSSKEYQRKLLTPKLRYEIMKRDHFRCVLCGKESKDGVELEVDHIHPVSKGGKTVPENLRTLCRECNRGKSDFYDPSKKI